MRHPELDRQRVALIRALGAAMKADDAGKLLGVKGEALERAIAVNRSIRKSPTLPAIERYTGVLYAALDAPSLPTTARRRLPEQVRIISGLWGLVAPNDEIPDYRLKMGASLAGIGKLGTAWRPLLTRSLTTLSAHRTIWDLLPNEHAAACRSSTAGRPVIKVRFVDDVGSGDTRKMVTVSHWNKLLKGALVRHVLSTGLDEPDGLWAFRHPEGYKYTPSLTTIDGLTTTVTFVARRL